MMTDPTVNTDSLNSAANPLTYHYAASIDWVKLCLNRVVATYFRDEDEISTAYEIAGLPIAQIGVNSWADSLVPEDAWGAAQDVALPIGGDAQITASRSTRRCRCTSFCARTI